MPSRAGKRLRVLTWHVHGNYLYNLSQVPHEFYLVTDPARGPHYGGRGDGFPWGPNVHEVHASTLAQHRFDVVLYQSQQAWTDDRHTLLSPGQRELPSIYLEHDPPQQSPTNQRHWADSPDVMLVHVTPFNALMWDSGRCTVRVVEHGVRLLDDGVRYTGELALGLTAVNHLARRGRRLGLDVYLQMQAQVPLRLVGMGAEELADAGGHGEVSHRALPAFMARHRFFFNPIRYTSLGLSVIEAMMVGLPVAALATTELASVIRNGESGCIDTRPSELARAMLRWLADPAEARQLGEGARRVAEERFHIGRFVSDWLEVFDEACG